MKILSVVNTLNRGGIQVQLLQSLPWLVDSGIEMDVCTVGPGVLDDDYRRFGCELFRIPKSANCWRTARHVGRILRERQYDCVHCNLQHTSGGYALAAATAGIPIAVSLHNASPTALWSWKNTPILSQVRAGWLRWHRYLMDKYVQVFVGHSVVNIRNYHERWMDESRRYRVILNGIEFPKTGASRSEVRRLLGIHADELTLLHVGSFKKEKNHSGLFEILSRVIRKTPNAKLISVGGGEGASAEIIARRMGLQQHVRFEGVKTNVWPYYTASDVFVFPSEAEGFGNVLVESQGAGLPVVASNIEPHLESVAPMQRRFLFSLPDYGQAADLVFEQVEAAKLGTNDWVEASRNHVRREFTIERFAADLMALYTDLAGRSCPVGVDPSDASGSATWMRGAASKAA